MRKSLFTAVVLTGALWFAWGPLPFESAEVHATTEFDDAVRDLTNEIESMTPPAGQQQGPGGRLREILQRLGLSREQRRQLHAIRSDFRSKMAPLRNEIQSMRRERESLQRSQNPKDRERLSQIEQRLGELKRQAMENMQKLKQEIMPILTPDQRKQFQDLMGKNRNP